MNGQEIAHRLAQAPETALEINRLAEECALEDSSLDVDLMAMDQDRVQRASREARAHARDIARLLHRIGERIK